MDKINHTAMQSATSFSGTRAGILKGVREEKGQYGYSDIVNACGLSYAKLYSEIEKRHDNEQEVEWQKSCARIAAQGQAF